MSEYLRRAVSAGIREELSAIIANTQLVLPENKRETLRLKAKKQP